MPEVKRIVCLANSRKHSGRCVAGKEWSAGGPGPWIRPVSNRPTQEVSEEERRYQDGTDPRLLDIMDVPLLSAAPSSYQAENWVLDPKNSWARVGTFGIADLADLVDRPTILWLNGSSTFAGLNDRVPQGSAEKLGESLYLLKINSATIKVFAPGANFGNPKRRVQMRFQHKTVEYWLWVTDPTIERSYLARNDGEYQVGESYVTVSLGEAHEGYCYKLVAAVILP